MACKMCDNAYINPLLGDDEDLSYISVGDFAERRRMMIRSGDRKPVKIIVEEFDPKSGWHLVGDYRPNFCPNCGRDLTGDYSKRNQLCIFWHPGPGPGMQRCEQIRWYPCNCNGKPEKCERRPFDG